MKLNTYTIDEKYTNNMPKNILKYKNNLLLEIKIFLLSSTILFRNSSTDLHADFFNNNFKKELLNIYHIINCYRISISLFYIFNGSTICK